MTHNVKSSWTGPVSDHPRLAWLGDDFTGAAAVMEVLSFAGLPSVLFLSEPTPQRQAAFAGVFGVGIASMARSENRAWMDDQLPGLFRTLAATGADIIQYKVCSTLDSAPDTGSIGRAIEIGLQVIGGNAVPVVIAAPRMRRYQAFGTLFAGLSDGVHRLDRHPVMTRHPVTPMTEADVARHLAHQTDLPTGCLDIEMLADPAAAQAILAQGGLKIWTIDQMGPAEEAAAGRLIWEGRDQNRFVVGSQGIAYALVRHWLDTGELAPVTLPGSIGRADRMAVVSGSVSPVTAAQITQAETCGFVAVPFAAEAVCGPDEALQQAEDTAVAAALSLLDLGKVPIIHSARGPDDPAVARLRQAVGQGDIRLANRRIGQALGRILTAVITAGGLQRVIVSGGDTSGDICQVLGIDALSALAPTIPGAAICRAHATGPMDGLEIALKGGQMGSDDYFDWVRNGGGNHR